MEEMVIRMVGNKLVFEVSLAQMLEDVAGKGKLTFEVSSAQIIQAVRDASVKAPAIQPGAKPGPKPAAPIAS
jgi:hypothetical protein